MSQFNQAPNRGFGYNHVINFGKQYKGRTYYDVANEGNYKYLRWCLQNDRNFAKDPSRFFIADSCLPHIRAALSTEGCKAIPWTKHYSEPDKETGKMILNYVSHNQESRKDLVSPDIETKICPRCNQVLDYLCFSLGNHDLCKKCYYEEEQNKSLEKDRYNKFYFNDPVENQKGSVQSYKPPRPNYGKQIYAKGKFQRQPVDPIGEIEEPVDHVEKK